MVDFILGVYSAFDTHKNLFEAAALPPISHMDLFRGQPLNPEQFEYYDIPAMFIDWRIAWTRQGKNYNGLLSVDFHLVTDPTWDTDNLSTNAGEGLKKTLYHAIARRILDKVKTASTDRLIRADENPVDTGVVNYHVLRYTTTYYEPEVEDSDYIEAMIEKINIHGQLVKTL